MKARLDSTNSGSTNGIVAAGWILVALGLTGIGFQHFFFGQYVPDGGGSMAAVDSGAGFVGVNGRHDLDRFGKKDSAKHQGAKSMDAGLALSALCGSDGYSSKLNCVSQRSEIVERCTQSAQLGMR
jgi:hypothetical protein